MKEEKKEKYVGLGVRVTKAFKKRFYDKAKVDRRKPSDQLRKLVEDYINE